MPLSGWGLMATLLRHARAPEASCAPPMSVRSLALSMKLTAARSCLVPPVGEALVLEARRLRTVLAAVDVPAIASGADDHLCSAPGAGVEALAVPHLWKPTSAAGSAGGMMRSSHLAASSPGSMAVRRS
jgi:hypothetical protein